LNPWNLKSVAIAVPGTPCGAGVPLTNASSIPYDGFLDGGAPDFQWLRLALEDRGSGLEKPAAIIVETVQGEGGLRAARASWLQELADICHQHGILLIVDDVQAGCGRTGTFFSFEESGIVPDIVCVSKSISGFGLPLALTLFKRELDLWKPGEHNGTFRGHNLAFVTATAALEYFWQDSHFEARIGTRADQLHCGLARIADTAEGATVRGRGLLAGIHYSHAGVAGRIAAESFARGLLVETSGPADEVLKTMPALTISAQEMDRGLAILSEAAASVTGRRTALKVVA
jgi:diaminobutyrate-2-oxoglutarate transaminase